MTTTDTRVPCTCAGPDERDICGHNDSARGCPRHDPDARAEWLDENADPTAEQVAHMTWQVDRRRELRIRADEQLTRYAWWSERAREHAETPGLGTGSESYIAAAFMAARALGRYDILAEQLAELIR